MNHLIDAYHPPHRMISLLILLGLIFLTACTDAVEPTSAPLPTQILHEPTYTPSSVPSFTSTVLSTSTPAITNTPTITLTPTFTPLTPLQGTFDIQSDEGLQNLFETLVASNSDCLLPCWWGIEPGKTTVSQAISFF